MRALLGRAGSPGLPQAEATRAPSPRCPWVGSVPGHAALGTGRRVMEEEGCVVLAPLGPNPEPQVCAMIPGAPSDVSCLPGGEARRNAAPQMPCSPWSSSPSPRRSPGHLNPKQASLQLATGLSERQGESWGPTDAVRGLGAAPWPQVSSGPPMGLASPGRGELRLRALQCSSGRSEQPLLQLRG